MSSVVEMYKRYVPWHSSLGHASQRGLSFRIIVLDLLNQIPYDEPLKNYSCSSMGS